MEESPILERMIGEGWHLMTQVLFCPESNMIYDSVGSHEPTLRFQHLPLVDEIAANVPNPAGWGTGMEDCMLNAGSAVEVAIFMARQRPELREEACAFARNILLGMRDCAEVHGVPGYVVRGISWRDGKSCYINSSRDQFTLFVYGVSRWMHCEFATEEDRQLCRRLLVEVGEYCLTHLQEENNCNLLRLDGGRALVSDMINVAPHEAMRLPMLYLGAYDASKDPRFLEAYRKSRVYGLKRTAEMRREYNWWNLELEQMQVSLRFCWDLDPDEESRQELLRLMQQVADFTWERFPEQEDWILGASGSFSQVSRRWNDAKMFLRWETAGAGKSALYDGRLYLKTEELPAFYEPFCMVRAIGNLTLALALTPQWQVPAGFPLRFQRCMAKCDWTTHTSGGVVNFLHGAVMLKEAMKNSQ